MSADAIVILAKSVEQLAGLVRELVAEMGARSTHRLTDDEVRKGIQAITILVAIEADMERLAEGARQVKYYNYKGEEVSDPLAMVSGVPGLPKR
jgi:hypothetical protein